MLEMKKLLLDEALITRPSIKGELRIFGMDESVTPDEIREAIAIEGDCKIEEVKVGRIGRTRSGTGVIWVKCPRNIAITIADKKRIPIGWSMVRIEMMKARPIQCHKCWRTGHVKEKCKSDKNYRGCCFKCGAEGHIALNCTNTVRCRICVDIGLKGNHRMGSNRCTVIKLPASQSNDRNTSILTPSTPTVPVFSSQKSGASNGHPSNTLETLDTNSSCRRTDDGQTQMDM